MTADLVIALVALFTALCALGFAIFVGYMGYRHRRNIEKFQEKLKKYEQ